MAFLSARSPERRSRGAPLRGAALASPGLAAKTPGLGIQLKAVFLFNFANFVDWPADAFPTPTRRWSSAFWG